ncbi:hypothetical protein PPHE_a3995 [Pseudoalteromonas phenolica O-BC30]|nr:hypothetical protein [Pseudoalteromonas phenolica O-BC30]
MELVAQHLTCAKSTLANFKVSKVLTGFFRALKPQSILQIEPI